MVTITLLLFTLPWAGQSTLDATKADTQEAYRQCLAEVRDPATTLSTTFTTTTGRSFSIQRGPAKTTALSLDDQDRAPVLAAVGFDLIIRGELARGTTCLELAHQLAPKSPLIARDLATAHAQKGNLERAAELAQLAIDLGDPDPEAQELLAMLLAELGRTEEAAQIATEAATWEAALIASTLGDRPSAHQTAQLALEDTGRGAMASLVLAAHEAARGEIAAAGRLALIAEQQAIATDAILVLNAARDLDHRLGARGQGADYSFRLRSSLDHTTNPSYQTRPDAIRALRLSLTAEGTLSIPFDWVQVAGALRLDQHVFLTERRRTRELDLTGLSLATGIRFPISRHPLAAVVGLSARFTDLFGNLMSIHYATAIEAGPDLTMQLASGAALTIGFYGVAADFIDVSPPDRQVSSQNRDRVGQRAAIALLLRSDWLRGRAEAMFLRDDALGDAFDSIGGAVAGRVEASLTGGVVLHTGFAITIREFGPVGDLSIIGPAATRTEFRTLVELGARAPIADNLFVTVDDVWMKSSARSGHNYTENVLSFGVERVW